MRRFLFSVLLIIGSFVLQTTLFQACLLYTSSMQGLGYKEILDYLDDKITLEEAIYRIKRDTRHFAKRQLTWFRRERDVIWVDKSEIGADTEALLAYMRPYYYSLR